MYFTLPIVLWFWSAYTDNYVHLLEPFYSEIEV